MKLLLALSLLAPLAGQQPMDKGLAYPETILCGDSGIPGVIISPGLKCGCYTVHNWPDFFREWFEYIPCPAEPLADKSKLYWICDSINRAIMPGQDCECYDVETSTFVPCAIGPPAKPEPVKPEPTKSKSEVVCISREAHWDGPEPAPPYCDNTAQNTFTFVLPEDSPIGCDPRATHPVGVRPSGELEDMCDHKVLGKHKEIIGRAYGLEVWYGDSVVTYYREPAGKEHVFTPESGLSIHGDTLKAMRLLFRKMEEEKK